ncbi:hypothetical protein FACS1894109_15910 [Spirochaetia bacterium]|nr:hypothetical protein FACS1894109_15910 [Spirochaetia bacterium]
MRIVKRLLFLPLVFVSMALPLHGATVSFLVVETGLREDAKANEYSTLWESSLMDVFFEGGHIVSNSPALRLARKSDKEFPDEALPDLGEAIDGGVNYFILAMLDFSSGNGNIMRPGDISLRLYQTRPYQFLYEERYAGKNSNNLNDEFARIKQTVRRLLPHLD